MTNRERFNIMLNNCANPRAVASVLSALAAEPSIQEFNDMGQKRQILVREIGAIVDDAGLDQAIQNAV